MKTILTRFVVAGVLAVSLSGCATMAAGGSGGLIGGSGCSPGGIVTVCL